MRSKLKLRLPSPALVVAVVALLVALSGTAIASGVKVPIPRLAIHSKTSDVATTAKNALKLNGQTSAALVSQAVSQASSAPGPASTAAGLVVIKTGTWSLNPHQENNFTTSCDAGQKAVGGGWADPGDWSSSYQSLPTPDDSGWTINLFTSTFAPGAQSGTLYAICLK